ncbi:hypothetical protein THIAE_08860 [Thiomicrospira aerophila AL3]|uniref:LPS-assembly lipoprotein LptE n=1 Tax=Thiomicrospira aerophila AL3 TaxID=717772 RepID=W0DXY7_9GAMM|nr:LPS assembly lipoprotein LptE [Thiomicrospira aerophila]AHF01849.1 hypothetical protein THIAE_08860 [Thiomicrospira aerophila AL3]
MTLTRRGLLAGLVTGSVAALSGCGFRLRGTGGFSGQLTMSAIYITGASPAGLLAALNQQLDAAGVERVSSLAQAPYHLELGRYETRTTTSARNQAGEVIGELIRMTQAIRLHDVANEQLLLDTQVMVMRDVQVDPAASLAAERERRDLQEPMWQELARNILDRVSRQLPAEPAR